MGATAARGWRWPAPVRAIGRFLYPSAPVLLPASLILAVALGVVAVHDYRQATDFVTHGLRVAAVQTRVQISEGGCRGGCAAITAVEAYAPELGWLSPRGPYAQPDLPDATPRGWQIPTRASGYQPPLPLYVINRPGGVLDAMAVADARKQRTSGLIYRSVGAVFLLLVFAAAIGPYVRRVKVSRALRRRRSGGLSLYPARHRINEVGTDPDQ